MPPGGLKKLELGGDRNRMAFIVALSVLIVLGLGVSVWVFFGGDPEESGKTDPDANFQTGLLYRCAACEKEFRMTGEDWAAMGEIDRSLGPVCRLPHCPHCGAKHSGLQMVKCLKCGTPFVPYGLAAQMQSIRNNGDLPPGARNVCPHCKTDQDEYSKTRSRK